MTAVSSLAQAMASCGLSGRLHPSRVSYASGIIKLFIFLFEAFFLYGFLEPNCHLCPFPIFSSDRPRSLVNYVITSLQILRGLTRILHPTGPQSNAWGIVCVLPFDENDHTISLNSSSNMKGYYVIHIFY